MALPWQIIDFYPLWVDEGDACAYGMVNETYPCCTFFVINFILNQDVLFSSKHVIQNVHWILLTLVCLAP